MEVITAAVALIALFLAWNNGSNNAANMVGTAVGAEVIELRKALRLASVATLAGSLLLGRYVTDTVSEKIVSLASLGNGSTVGMAMISVLLAASMWTLLCSFLRIPMSVHACVIGGLIGVGAAMSVESIEWGTLTKIFAFWVAIPFTTAFLSFALLRVLDKPLSNPRELRMVLPLLAFSMMFIPIALSTAKLRGSTLCMLIPIGVGTASALVTYRIWVRNGGEDPAGYAARLLLIESLIAMSFAFGSNSVANAAGPLAMTLLASGKVTDGDLATEISAMVAGLALSVGIVTWGSSVVETVGKKITVLSVKSAFVAQFSAALVMMVVSRLGIPASTSMAIVGGIMGVGIARGVRSVELRTVAKIMGMWYAAIPAVAGTAYALLSLMRIAV